MQRQAGHQVSTLTDYAHLLWRRKWLILLVVALATSAAVFVSARQKPVYAASADVLLRHDNFTATLTGVTTGLGNEDPVRLNQNQADLARVPPLARRVVRAAGASMTAGDFLGHSSVTPKTNSDLLTFRVENGSPALAVRLATEYARQYTIYRRQLDTASIAGALKEAESRIAELKASGQEQSPLYASLVDKAQLLGTMNALQTSNTYLVPPAHRASKVSPRPARNGALAFTLGLILGVGLAFLWETLDTRVRSAEEIGSRLGLPLLARLPAPPRKIASKNHLVTIEEPNSVNAEAFRVLRTNLEFVNLERRARLIMVTSAVEGEGKSTTAANLAVTLARSGKRVVLVDLDLRRPFVHEFFELPRERGVTQVALGYLGLDEAMTRVALAHAPASEAHRASGNGGGPVEGFLDILPSGPIPPNPGEFATGAALGDILRSLSERADAVVIDAPPLLHIGDALALSSRVDALILVARLHTLRRSMLGELHRVLEACPASKLGFVLAGAELEEGYGFGAYGYYGQPAAEESVMSRNVS